MKIDWNPETKRIGIDMPKQEAWALLDLLNSLVVLDQKPIVKEYKRAFVAMQRKDERRCKNGKRN